MEKKGALLFARCWFDSSTPHGYCLMDSVGDFNCKIANSPEMENFFYILP